jgi:hypothetical protein
VASINVYAIALPHPSVAVACVNDGVAGQLIVDGAGSAAMTGAEISWTLMVCVAVDVLPQPSVAVHFLLTVYDPAHAPGVVISIEDSVTGLLPQPSVAAACAKTGVAGQLMVLGAGIPVIAGPVTSCTLMV